MLYVNIPASNLKCIGLTMCVFPRVFFFSSENYTVNSTDPHIYKKKTKQNKTKQSKTKEKKNKTLVFPNFYRKQKEVK